MEKEIEEQTLKTNFFKKIYYSIFKITKYDELSKKGLKDAIKYILKITALVTCILAIFLSFNMKKYVSQFAEFIDKNIPEFSIEDNVLNFDNEEAIILDNEEFSKKIDSVIVINPLLEEKEAIKEYKDIFQDNNCIIFIKNEAIFVSKGFVYKEADIDSGEQKEQKSEESNDTKLKVLKYDELLSVYNINIENKFTKADLINSIANNPITYYFAQYYIIYFIILIFTFIIDIAFIAVMGLIFSKVLKIEINSKKEIFTISAYEFTLPIILQLIYLVLSIIFDFSLNSSIIQTIMILIGLVYMVVILNKRKK